MAQGALPGHADQPNGTKWAQLSLADMWDFLNLEQRVAWATKYELTGITIKADSEGWLVVLRLADHKGNYVHFTGGRSFQSAVEALLWEVDKGHITPKADKYAR